MPVFKSYLFVHAELVDAGVAAVGALHGLNDIEAHIAHALGLGQLFRHYIAAVAGEGVECAPLLAGIVAPLQQAGGGDIGHILGGGVHHSPRVDLGLLAEVEVYMARYGAGVAPFGILVAVDHLARMLTVVHESAPADDVLLLSLIHI